MAAFTAQQVMELRHRTGVGMAKCKEALEQSQGDMEAAIDNLRKAGIASAVKKEGRETKEGLLAYAEDQNGCAIVEINSETDFVAKNERFQQFLKEMAQELLLKKSTNAEEFAKSSYSKDASTTIDDQRSLIIQTLGENVQFGRLVYFAKGSDRSIGLYSHMGGKMVTAVELIGKNGEEALARDIAMHTAAEAPEYLTADGVPADVKAREEAIAKEQVAGKPANVIDKIVAGKMQTFFAQVCLLEQKFIKDQSQAIRDLLAKRSKEIGVELKLSRCVRWTLGEKSGVIEK